MNKLSISTILKTCAVFWLLPLLYAVITSLGDSEDIEHATNINDYEMPEITAKVQVKVNNQPLIELYDLLLPTRKQINPDSNEESEAAKVKKVIDKTLLPNFSTFDEQHQISLAGIFKEQRTFAVVQLVNYETKASEFRKLEIDNQIGNYRLATIADNKVVLISDNAQIQLELFKQDS